MSHYLSKQKWTNKQKEIWKNVEDYTKLILEGNLGEFIEYFHKDYSSWNSYDLLPVTKTDVSNELQHLKKHKIDNYALTPLVIKVFRNVAIVHYIYSAEFINDTGNKKTKLGHNTDILLKIENKWIIICDHISSLKSIHERQNIKFWCF